MTPQLARTYGPKYSHFPCFLQPKLNGIRALYQKGRFQSRDEKLWKPEVLAHLSDQLLPLSDALGDTILDGELYVHGWRLQRINSAVAVNRKEPSPETHLVSFHIFDAVQGNFSENFTDRWLGIYNSFPFTSLLRVVPTTLCYLREEVDLHFQQYVSLGYEGVMLRPDGPYVTGTTPHGTTRRSPFLWKHKSWTDGEYLCIGWEPGEGKAAIGMGALVLRTEDGKEFNCGTGFSDEERVEYAYNPPTNQMVKVRFPYLSEDGVPQCPSFLAVMLS